MTPYVADHVNVTQWLPEFKNESVAEQLLSFKGCELTAKIDKGEDA